MKTKNIWEFTHSRLKEQWIICRLISNKKSVQYGIRFSYPVYILLVLLSMLSENPYILYITALIAFFGMTLPMHPFDYVYNSWVVKLIGTNKIPGRGSELQVNSTVALIFTLVVVALISFRIPINYFILAILYLASSIFFLCIFLLKKDPDLTK